MKKHFILLLFVTSGCFAQFKFTYKEIMDKYHPKKNEIIDGRRVYSKTLKDSVKARYFFTLTDSSFVTMTLDRNVGFSKKEVEDFQNEYLNNFKPTRTRDSRENEHIMISYDEEKSMMMLNVFSEIDPKKLIQISFTMDKNLIKEIVALMNLGY